METGKAQGLNGEDMDAREISLYREIAKQGQALEALVLRVQHFAPALGRPGPDQRWVAIAQTHLQQGLAALRRAIAHPKDF